MDRTRPAHSERGSPSRGPGIRAGRRARARARRLGLALLAAAGLSAPAAAEPTVAVLFSAKVSEYDDALAGFEESFGGRVVARENMEGDFDRARQILDRIDAQVKPDLILAIGVWALRAVVAHPTDRPVVYTMVLNPESVVGKAPNVAGASMNVSAEKAIALLVELDPGIRRVGVVYNDAKTGAQVRQAQATARKRGIELVAREVASAGQAVPALKSLQEAGIDALWILPDETVLAPTVMKHFFRISYQNKLPTLGVSERQAKMGALLAISFGSTRDIGRQAGELARAVAAGRPVALTATTARELAVTVNLKVARKLGVEVPESLLVSANKVIK